MVDEACHTRRGRERRSEAWRIGIIEGGLAAHPHLISAAFLTDYRTSFALPFREVKAEQHADSGDADRHLEEERGHPESEPYREFAKSERDSLFV